MKQNLFTFRHEPNEFQAPTTRALDGGRTGVDTTVRGRWKRSSFLNPHSLILLFSLFLGLGFSSQAWAGNSFWETYMTYDKNGSGHNYTFSGTKDSYDLGTITSDFTITNIYYKCWDNWNDYPYPYGAIFYKINGGDQQEYKSWDNKDWKSGNNNFEIYTKGGMNLTIASSTNPSGNYSMKMFFEVGGNSGYSKIQLNNGGSWYEFTYTILPHAVTGFSASVANSGGGTGASDNPFIVYYNQAVTLTVTADASSDSNEKLQFSYDGGSNWVDATSGTTGTTSLAATQKTSGSASKVIKYRYYNTVDNLAGNAGETTIYYRSSEYTITLNSNGGTANGHCRVKYGATSIVTWNNNTDVDATKTGYRLTTSKYYTIGTSSSSTVVLTSHSGTFPANTTYTDANGKWKEASNNAILYAQWTAQTYTLTLDDNNGTGNTTSKNVTYDANTNLSQKVTIPTKTGQDFTGYWTNTNGTGTKLVDNTGYFLNEVTGYIKTGKLWGYANDLTIYAGWSDHVYSITYKDQGDKTFSGDWGSVTHPTTHTYNTATPLVDAPNKTGYTFGGWYTTSTCEGDAVTSLGATAYTANITLYAKWTANVTNITVYRNYNNDDNTTEAAVTASYDCTIGQVTGLPKTGYSRTGYTHNGLYLARSGGSYLMKYNNSAWTFGNVSNYCTATYWKYAAGGALNLYSQWTAKTYTITFKPNGGSSAETTKQATYDSRTSIATCDLPTHSSANFAGYYLNDAGTGDPLYNAECALQSNVAGYTDASGNWIHDGNVDVYAKWTSTYIITLNNMGATSAGTAQVEVETGKTTGLTSSITPPTKTGYAFDGYYTGASGAGTKLINANGSWVIPADSYIDNDGKWIPSSGVELKANWIANQTTVTFDKQYGKGGTSSRTLTYNSTNFGDALVMPTRGGFTFGGYFTEPDGKGVQLITDGGAWIAGVAGYTDSPLKWIKTTTTPLTIYAKWTEIKYNLKVTHQYYNCVGSGNKITSGEYAPTHEIVSTEFGAETGYSIDASGASKDGFYHTKWVLNTNATVYVGSQQTATESSTKTINGATGSSSTLRVDSGYATSGTEVNVLDRWREYARYVDVYAVNGTIQGDSADLEEIGIYTAKTVVAIPNTGYQFKDWTVVPASNNYAINLATPSSPTTEVRVASNITTNKTRGGSITANFTPINYTIKYNTNGGTAIADGSYTIETETFDLPTTSTKTGYDFEGWYTESTLQNKVTEIAVGSHGDKEFWAKWTPHTYTVVYNGNGATTGSMDNQDFTYDVAQPLTNNIYGRSYQVTFTEGGSIDPMTASYTFVNWLGSNSQTYTNGQSVSNLTSVDNDVFTMTAQWTGGTITLPTPTKVGSVFDGWYDGDTRVGGAGDSYTPGAVKELSARWTAVNVYLEGRARVKNAEGVETTINAGSAWDQTLKTIPFTFNSTDGVYYLNTYCTILEQAAQVGGGDNLIRIGKANGDGAVTGWGCGTEHDYLFTPEYKGSTVGATNGDVNNKSFKFRDVEKYENDNFKRRYPVMYRYNPTTKNFDYCAPLLTLNYSGTTATMTGYTIAIANASVVADGLTDASIVYQIKKGDDEWAEWTKDSIAAQGTYKLRAVASGNNEFGQAVENVISNEITITVTTPAVSAKVTHVNGNEGSIIRINDSFTIQHTVTGVPAGQSVQVCYHWKTKPEGSKITKDVFTKVTDPKQPNSVYTTIDVAGDYEIEVSVSSATCETSGVITWQTYTLPIHVKGDEITVYAKLDKSITDWNSKYVHYWKSGVPETTGWPGHEMAYIGKDSTDYEWYSYNITNYKTYAGGNLLFNDGTTTYGKQQTTNLDMPEDDAFYMIKTVTSDKKRTASVEDAIDVTKRVVLMNKDLDKLYQYVTITLDPLGIFVPIKDAEMKYTYVMTSKPDGSTVVLNNKNYFTPDKAGTYKVTITCTATGVTSDVFSNTFDLVVAANPLTLTPSATGSNIQIGATTSVTVSAEAKDITDLYKTFTVIEPGTKDPITFKSGAKDAKSTDYTLRSSGTYTFGVVLTDNDGKIAGKAQCTVSVNAKALYIKHPFVNKEEKDIASSDWKWNDLSYNEIDGTYQYSGDDAYYHPSKVANVHTSKPESSSSLTEYTIQNPDNLPDNTKCLFVYDVTTDEVTVYDLNKRLYRIKSVCENGEEYFSNAVTYKDDELSLTQELSFFAIKGGQLIWQKRDNAASNWNDVTTVTITTTVDANGIYTANPTKEQANFTLTAYTGDLTVFTQLTKTVTNDGTPTSPNGKLTKIISQIEGDYYNYYWVKYCTTNNGSNVRQAMATIGNSINNCIATTLPYYELPASANVRYAYNDQTNSFTRTYLAGSGDTFLRIYGDNIKDKTNTNDLTKSNAQKFEDGSNWVFTSTVYGTVDANNSATAILMTDYNGTNRWILAESGLEADPAAKRVILDENGTTAGNYKLNVIYDYKTNRITSGWDPVGQTINSEISIPQLMATRTNDGAASEFTITDGQVLVTNQMIEHIIITKKMFDEWYDNETGGEYKTMFFWFSVPYEFKAGDIYGFNGQYRLANNTSSWEIQSYRGEMRDKGTAGNSPWKRPKETAVMDKNAGYVLAVRTKASDFKTADDVSQIRFFIPSTGSVTLKPTATIELAADTTNKDKIQRDWHVMNIPVMQSGCSFTNAAEEKEQFELVYRWSWANGGRWYEPMKIHDTTDPTNKNFNFQAGHAYMVQGHGALTWDYNKQGYLYNAPMRDVALTNKDLRIDLNYDGEQQDKTYVLYRETGTREYEIGRDLEKIMNNGRSMIYSELNSKLASICLSDTDMVQIPLTVVANEAGEYTLRMPAPVSGIEPVLYDYENETPVTTLLNYNDYTIYLGKGTYTNRFFLGVKTTPFTPTTISETGSNGGERAYKFIRDNQLFILRDGVVYDAQGRKQ